MQVERILNKYSDSISKKEDIFAEKNRHFFSEYWEKDFYTCFPMMLIKLFLEKG